MQVAKPTGNPWFKEPGPCARAPLNISSNATLNADFSKVEADVAQLTWGVAHNRRQSYGQLFDLREIRWSASVRPSGSVSLRASGRHGAEIDVSKLAEDPTAKQGLAETEEVFVPSIAVGELLYGARISARGEENRTKVETFVAANACSAAIWGRAHTTRR